MSIVVVGLNHRTAPVEVRERVAFSQEEAAAALSKRRKTLREGVLLSTCNRTEVYAASSSISEGWDAIVDLLARQAGTTPDALVPFLYSLSGDEAVRHLFRVSAGLDSLVLGETQIQGQVKESFLSARARSMAGRHLGMLFEAALAGAKRARTETAIGQNAVSVGYAAVELAKKIFPSLHGAKVLLIGAGKMGELTAEHLRSSGASAIRVANRTYSRARELAERFAGEAIDFVAVEEQLASVDVVISSTGAPHVVLERQVVERVMKGREDRPLFLIDLAVPRDIDPAAGHVPGVFLYDIDDLEHVIAENLEGRAREGQVALAILEEEAQKFLDKERTLESAAPLIRSLRRKAEEIRAQELARAFAKLPDLTERERQVIEVMSTHIVNKLLNDPTVAIKEYATGADAELYLDALSRLFRLSREEEEGPVEAALWR